MRIEVVPISELSEDMRNRWLEIQSFNSNLMGPCFHPDLFLAVGKFCQNVYVALLYEKNDLMGFLPYLRNRRLSTAQTIDFCDYQAIIGPKSHHWEVEKILKRIGLRSWDCNSLVDYENIRSTRMHGEVRGAMRVDLSDGYDGYLLDKKQARVKFEGLARKKRSMEAGFGPIRFEPVCNDREVLHRMLSWKTIRHRRDLVWKKLATDLLEHFCYSNSSSIKGVLSALFVENRLLAAFFGMRYQGVLHSLVCAFNPDFEKFSPGLILWQNLISEHEQLQYRILDFGPSDHKYKRYFSNSTLPIVRGNFSGTSIKERIKSIGWLYQGLYPVVQGARRLLPVQFDLSNGF